MVEKYIVIKTVTQLGASKNNFMEDCHSYKYIPIKKNINSKKPTHVKI